MPELRPWSSVHRGSVLACGFVFDSQLIGEAEARLRILSLWQPKARAFSVKGGLVLLLQRKALVVASEACGLPIVELSGVLSTAPLRPAELDQVRVSAGEFLRVRGGKLLCERLSDEFQEYPEDWLDISGFDFAAGVPLGSAPAAPIVVEHPQQIDLRVMLGNIPEQASEVKVLLARLRGGQSSEPVRTSRRFSWFSLVSLAHSVRQWVGTFTLRKSGTARSKVMNSPKPSTRATSAISWPARWLRSLFTRLTLATRFSKVLGWRQGRYLASVLEMFDDGDIDSALRHAIPLSAVAESPVLRISRGVPRPRHSLQLNPFATVPSSTIPLGQSLYSHLQLLYRTTFQRLEAQGRISEAAFVLAELMRADAEAVAFLERHGRLREAAEIAEARKLDPEIVVRQWFLAGEKERAVHVAKQTGSFQGAVLRLEKSHHPEARRLRICWAESLAEAGTLVPAVDALWPLESERYRALEWMKLAVESGGRSGARMLARLAGLRALDFQELRARVEALLGSESPDEAPARLEFADVLRKEPRSPETQTLARAAVRSMLRDAGQGFLPMAPIPLYQLVQFSGDAAIRADLPRQVVGRKVELCDLDLPRQHVVHNTDCGLSELADAAYLPNGNSIVALGEAGIHLINREGRVVAHFDRPAERIVIAESGNKVIALARRGDMWSLSRIDLLNRRSHSWAETAITSFARSFDGGVWYIASGDDVFAVDATAVRFEALWRVPEVGKTVGPLTVTDSSLSFVSLQGAELTLWEYRTPSMRLLRRSAMQFHREMESVGRLCLVRGPGETILDCSTVLFQNNDRARDKQTQEIHFSPTSAKWMNLLTMEPGETIVGDPVVAGLWFGFAMKGPSRSKILLYHFRVGRGLELRLAVEIYGQVVPSVRLDASSLVIADDAGRLQVFDLTYGDCIRDLRI